MISSNKKQADPLKSKKRAKRDFCASRFFAKAMEDSGSSSDSEQQQWDEWVDDSQEKTKGLFSNATFKNPAECWKNCKEEFDWDHDSIYKEWNLDDYQHIQLINFIRTQQSNPSFNGPQLISSLKEKKNSDGVEWRDEKYLIPVVPDDPVIFYLEQASDVRMRGESFIAIVIINC
jgi:hypothetical protein